MLEEWSESLARVVEGNPWLAPSRPWQADS